MDMEDNFTVFIQTSKVFESILFLTRVIREMRIGNAILQKINYMNRNILSIFELDVGFIITVVSSDATTRSFLQPFNLEPPKTFKYTQFVGCC